MSKRSLKSRRDFLRLSAGTAGAAAALHLLPASIARALEIPAHSVTRSIMDVQHVVILMQENRSFDHYFGSLRGVRGFGDRIPFPQPNGESIWRQSDGKGNVIQPFHLDTRNTSAQKVPDLNHSWESAQGAFNSGKWDQWIPYKSSLTMGHYRRDDLPFQYALADAFTVCDAYHCAIHGCTAPNRIFFWTGGNDPHGKHGGPVIATDSSCALDFTTPVPGFENFGHGPRYTFTTYPERLEQANVSWKIYQDPKNNFWGLMNACVSFQAFNDAPPGSSLHSKAMSLWTLDDLKADVQQNKLPQVSWICPSQEQSEHPAGSSPIEGASFTQQVLEVLTSNPEVWSKTALFITFDENDGFFDHMPPPSPPPYRVDGTRAGLSTIDTEDDFYNFTGKLSVESQMMESAAKRFGAKLPDKLALENCPEKIPYGMSVRVPMYVVSPWSRGGWVNSQVFDHTSVIRFMEKRFGVAAPNITPWRRAVSGDLTTAFDFENPNNSKLPAMPDVSKVVSIVATQSQLPVPAPPAADEHLFQEHGVRPSRALPYDLQVIEHSSAAPDQIGLEFGVQGGVAAVFYVYDRLRQEEGPRIYTVESEKTLVDHWHAGGDGRYDLWVYGPNGYLRVFKGDLAGPAGNGNLSVTLQKRMDKQAVSLLAVNTGKEPCMLVLKANAYRKSNPVRLKIAPGKQTEHLWSIRESGNWYDVTATTEETHNFERRFAGRLETGQHSISDPAAEMDIKPAWLSRFLHLHKQEPTISG